MARYMVGQTYGTFIDWIVMQFIVRLTVLLTGWMLPVSQLTGWPNGLSIKWLVDDMAYLLAGQILDRQEAKRTGWFFSQLAECLSG